MVSFNLKKAPVDVSPTSDDEILFGAMSQSASNPVVYTFGGIKAWILSWVPIYAPLKDQHITAGPSIAINNDAGIVRVNQAVGAPIEVVVPFSAVKTCDCLIVDWKGDATINNITITLTAPDVFPGGATQRKIVSDRASVYLRRIPGVGYAL